MEEVFRHVQKTQKEDIVNVFYKVNENEYLRKIILGDVSLQETFTKDAFENFIGRFQQWNNIINPK
jgi:hypothetical protein